MALFEIMAGAIETLAVDAIVSAANRELAPGKGVDAAIRAAAGPGLTAHTNALPAIEIGEAVLTPGFGLPARHVIHTAAPVWSQDGEEGVKVAGLAGCYTSAIKLAQMHRLVSLAFPCIGSGAFGWPPGFACAIAIAACEEALAEAANVKRVIFCCFSQNEAQLYRAALS